MSLAAALVLAGLVAGAGPPGGPRIGPTGPAEPPLAEAVAAAIRAATPELRVEVEGPWAVRILEPGEPYSGGLRMNLHHLASRCAEVARAPCIAHWVEALDEVRAKRGDRPDPAQLRVLLRPRAPLLELQASRTRADQRLVFRDFGGGLVAVLALDLERSLRFVMQRDLLALGLSEADAFDRGRVALVQHTPPAKIALPPVQAGKIGIVEDAHAGGWLLRPAAWRHLAREGDEILAAAPAATVLLYVTGSRRDARDDLQALVAKVHGRAPRALSTQIFRWTAGGFLPVK